MNLIAVYILEILESHASRDNKMGQNLLLHYLDVEFGIQVSRRTLTKYISALRDAGYVEGNRGICRKNKFTDVELRLLMDGILYGKHIPQTEAIELLEKLKKLSLEKLRKTKHIYYVKELQHTENKKLYEILDALDDAIERNKKVEITKCTYNQSGELEEAGKRVVDPYFIVSSKSMYYLICYSGRDGQLENRRIDRILNVKVLEENRKDINNLECNRNCQFDLGNYMKEHIYMFSGESKLITLRIMKHVIGDVIDWYGKNYKVLEEDESTITIRLKANVNAAYYWVIQYGKDVEVISPIELREQIQIGLQEMLDKYSK